MPNPGKPIMGFPNRRAAVKALLDEGLGREDIAVRLGIEPDEVRSTLRDLRGTGVVSPPARKRGPTRSPKRVSRPKDEVPPVFAETLVGRTVVSLERISRAMNETRFRLQRPDGAYLHMSIVGSDGALAFTRERAWSWLGYRAQLQAVLRAHAAAKRLAQVRVMPEAKAELAIGRVG